MLSLDFIRLHPDVVREGLRRRGDAQDIDEILRLIEQRRGLVTRCDGLYAELKPLREQVRVAPEERREAINKQIKAKSRDIRLDAVLVLFLAPQKPGARSLRCRRHTRFRSSLSDRLTVQGRRRAQSWRTVSHDRAVATPPACPHP